MLGSLRFRLPALFLLGIVLAGLVAALISIRFFQSYTHDRAVDELRSESVGIERLYAQQAGAREVPAKRLEDAPGGGRTFFGSHAPAGRLFGVPVVPEGVLFVGDLPQLPRHLVDVRALETSGPLTMNLEYEGSYLAV